MENAPTPECAEFVLTAMNDQDCYELLREGYTASSLYKTSSYLNSLNLDRLDFIWLNSYIAERLREEDENV